MTQLAEIELVGEPLTWFSVKNLKSSLEFYVDVLGYEITYKIWEYRYAELRAPNGGRIGLSQEGPLSRFSPGQNGIYHMKVKDIDRAYEAIKERPDMTILSDIIRYPGHGLMLNFMDKSGNQLQFFQEIDE